MFDKLKTMGTMAALLKDKDRVLDAAQRIKQRAAELHVDGQAGAGAVRVIVNGKLQLVQIKLEPALAEGMAGDAAACELAESLIVEAVNDGIKNAQAAMKVLLEREAKELGLHNLPGELGSLLT